MIKAIPYTPEFKSQWDEFVLSARNSTLLHLRSYMDYHADRFKDASLVFVNNKGKWMALLPANICGDTIYSHQGLTYGGFVTASTLHTNELEAAVYAAVAHYKTMAQQLIIKPIPYIYSNQPNDEELYLIYRQGGILAQRHISQAINLQSPLQMAELRKRCISKAAKSGITIAAATTRNDWDKFHAILTTILADKHSTTPVHTPDELWLLHSAFPSQIQLIGAYDNGNLIAGTIVYVSPNTIHTQYLASSPRGQETGALDLVIYNIIAALSIADRKSELPSLASFYGKAQYLDFGVSTERNGSLNYGLTLQKEGFGARGICYDTYSIKL